HGLVGDEEPGDRPGREEADDAGRRHEPERESDRGPPAALGVVRSDRAEVLSDERAGRGGEAEPGEKRDREDADADEVRGHRRGPVAGREDDVEEEPDLHEEVLDRRGVADAEHPPDDVRADAVAARAETDHEPSAREEDEAEERARDERRRRRRRRAEDTERREPETSEDEHV